MRCYRPWTNREIERVRYGYVRGRPVSEIAAELGRSRSSIAGIAKRYDFSWPRQATLRTWTNREMVIMRFMRSHGAVPREIAKVLSRTPGSVKAMLYRERRRAREAGQ